MVIRDKAEFLAECIEVQKKHFKTSDLTGMYYIDVARLEDMFRDVIPNLKILKGWALFLRKGSYRGAHKHNDMTGVYYLKAPRGSGKLWFDIMPTIEPVEDGFHMFPPGMEHSISRHESDEDRWSIALEMAPTYGDKKLRDIQFMLPKEAFNAYGNPVYVEDRAQWYF